MTQCYTHGSNDLLGTKAKPADEEVDWHADNVAALKVAVTPEDAQKARKARHKQALADLPILGRHIVNEHMRQVRKNGRGEGPKPHHMQLPDGTEMAAWIIDQENRIALAIDRQFYHYEGWTLSRIAYPNRADIVDLRKKAIAYMNAAGMTHPSL